MLYYLGIDILAQGCRNKQIANHLFISESTIKSHLYALYKKLQVSSRLEAILYYYHNSGQLNPVPATSLSERPTELHAGAAQASDSRIAS